MSSATDPPSGVPTDVQQALLRAVAALFAPVSQLAIAHGVPYAAIEEALKRAMVDAAARAHPQVPAHRNVSRISTVTGLNRREVTRLSRQSQEPGPAPRSFASEVVARWISARPWCDAKGRPRELPRLGPSPSFDALAQSVTRDVHPRSLLDELLRLKLVALDEDLDFVRLTRESFVPAGDLVRMVGFLSDNVGDHLQAAVDNLLGDSRQHFEQAIFADGLSEASVQAVRGLIAPQWKSLVEALVPRLQECVTADAAQPPERSRRMRIGLFVYDDAPAQAPNPAVAAPPRRRRSGPGPSGTASA